MTVEAAAPVVAPAAVLWDMDGTLVDTEPYWVEVEQRLVESHGGVRTREHAMQLVGNDLLESGRYIREHGGVDLSPEEIVEVLLDGVVEHIEQSVPWRPGARELLAALRADGVPCALVTMSYERFVAPVLAALDACERDWVAYHRGTVEFHLRNAAAWANRAVGADLAAQVEQLLHPPHEVAGGQAGHHQHVVEVVALGPAVGRPGEPEIGLAQEVELVLPLQRVQLSPHPHRLCERRLHAPAGDPRR